MGVRVTVLSCTEMLHLFMPLTMGWKHWLAMAANSPGWFSCTAIRVLKQQPVGSQHQVQIQQIGISGSKLDLSGTLVRACRVLAACRATSRTSDPFSSHAGVLRDWELEPEIMPLLT